MTVANKNARSKIKLSYFIQIGPFDLDELELIFMESRRPDDKKVDGKAQPDGPFSVLKKIFYRPYWQIVHFLDDPV